MKHLLLSALLASAGTAAAQTAPTITSADMPLVGDTLRSSQTVALPTGAPSFTVSGANQTWNYAGLVPASQRVDRFLSVSDAAVGLQAITFGALGGVNQATLAQPRSLPAGAGAVLPITDPKEFFKVSSSDFRSVGFGATYTGIGLPVTYRDQAHQDVIYRFPLAYGNTSDISYSDFEVSAPGTATLRQRRQRTNEVDGWGTVTTPFGTFQALRVVTTLTDRDSLVVGTTPGGPATLLPTQRQYKWLANGVHVPVLTITTTEVGGTQQVTAVEYRDSYRRIASSLATRSTLGTEASAYPNPLGPEAALRLRLPAGSGPGRVTATDVVGRQVFSQAFAGGAPEVVLDAAAFGSWRGVLLLTVRTGQGAGTFRVVRQ